MSCPDEHTAAQGGRQYHGTLGTLCEPRRHFAAELLDEPRGVIQTRLKHLRVALAVSLGRNDIGVLRAGARGK
jgi:hypothetical protein